MRTSAASEHRLDRRVSFQIRKRWLLEQIAQRRQVDVLNAEFVEEYAKYTAMKYRLSIWGAGWCPQLARDLRQMAQLRLLKRATIGLSSGAWQPGFPKWVYSYSLSGVGREALRNES